LGYYPNCRLMHVTSWKQLPRLLPQKMSGKQSAWV
jgi:hypothetical protein